MAAQILQTISKDERERWLYESQLIHELDQRSAEESARLQGEIRGEMRGEVRTKREIVENLKLKNFPLDEISEIIGISVDELMVM